MKEVAKYTGEATTKLSARSSSGRKGSRAGRPKTAARPENGSVVAFPSGHASIGRDVARLGGNLQELATAVHASFLAIFATIPQSLLAAAAELIAARQREELAAHWRATLHLYADSLEAGLIIVGIIGRANDLQQLGWCTAESIHRIRTLALDEIIVASQAGADRAYMLSLFNDLSTEAGHFNELLAELRRRTDRARHHAEPHETNSVP